MSTAEGLNENLEEQNAEKTQDAFPTVQHTPDNRRTNSLPGISTCSRWIEQNTITYEMDGTRSRRPRNLTENRAAYKLQTLKEKRRKINGRLIRKHSTVEDLLFSSRNAVIVEEELGQFNDLIKMLVSVHEECNGLLREDERQNDDEWFDEIVTQAFSFKRKINAWLRERERGIRKETSSRSSSKGSRSSSRKSGRSKFLKGSKSSRETKS